MSEKHGLDLELEAKRLSKYDSEFEKKAMLWIQEIVSDSTVGVDFFTFLKNGVILCKLINNIAPGSCPRYDANPKHYLEEKANLQHFLDACMKIGIPSQDLFTPLDFSESRKDVNQILQTIHALARQAQAIGWKGPRLGVRYYLSVSDQKKRQEKRSRQLKEEQERIQAQQESLRRRREFLENEKLEMRTDRVQKTRSKIYARRTERDLRGRNHLRRSEVVVTDSEMDHTPSPVRFGMDLETQKRKEAGYDHVTEELVLDWVEDMTGEVVDSLFKSLRSGVILCKLVNAVRPGLIKKIHEQKIPLLQRENVSQFLDVCVKLGIKKHNLFSVSDLCEKKDLGAVLNCLYALYQLYQTPTAISPIKEVPSPSPSLNTILTSEPSSPSEPLSKRRKNNNNNSPISDEIPENPKIPDFPEEFNEKGHHEVIPVIPQLSPCLVEAMPATVGIRRQILTLIYYVVVMFLVGGHFGVIQLEVEPKLEAIASLLNTATQLSLIAFVAAGVTVDLLGPRATLWCGLGIKIVGCIIIAFSGLYNNYGVGFMLFFFGGPFTLVSTLHIIPFFSGSSGNFGTTDIFGNYNNIGKSENLGYSGITCTLLATAYFGGSGLMYQILQKALYSYEIPHLSIFIVVAVVYGGILASSVVMWPPKKVGVGPRVWTGVEEVMAYVKSLDKMNDRWFLFYAGLTIMVLLKSDFLLSSTLSIINTDIEIFYTGLCFAPLLSFVSITLGHFLDKNKFILSVFTLLLLSTLDSIFGFIPFFPAQAIHIGIQFIYYPFAFSLWPLYLLSHVDWNYNFGIYFSVMCLLYTVLFLLGRILVGAVGNWINVGLFVVSLFFWYPVWVLHKQNNIDKEEKEDIREIV